MLLHNSKAGCHLAAKPAINFEFFSTRSEFAFGRGQFYFIATNQIEPPTTSYDEAWARGRGFYACSGFGNFGRDYKLRCNWCRRRPETLRDRAYKFRIANFISPTLFIDLMDLTSQ